MWEIVGDHVRRSFTSLVLVWSSLFVCWFLRFVLESFGDRWVRWCDSSCVVVVSEIWRIEVYAQVEFKSGLGYPD